MASRMLYRMVATSWKICKTSMIPKHNHKNVCAQLAPASSHHTNISRRWYSQEVTEMAVDFDYVKKATNNNKALIIDVREPDELKEHGKIPNSINIPLGNVSTVLSQMNEKDFEQIYHRSKPSEDTEIIFYCMIGKRSGMAQENAQKLGYKNVKNYLGSWNDWASKNIS